MIGRRLRLMHRGQRGLTLVELLIAVALVGIVTAGVTMTISHVFTRSVHTRDHMTAVRQVQSAGHWVSRDALQAQVIEPDPEGQGGFPLTLSWQWEDEETERKVEVRYVLQGDQLHRIRFVDDTVEDSGVVAQFVESVEVSPRTYYGGKITFTVTANVAGQRETRVYEIRPRPYS